MVDLEHQHHIAQLSGAVGAAEEFGDECALERAVWHPAHLDGRTHVRAGRAADELTSSCGARAGRTLVPERARAMHGPKVRTPYVLYYPAINPQKVLTLGSNISKRLGAGLLGPHPQSGVFLDSCMHHCGSWNFIRIDGEGSLFSNDDKKAPDPAPGRDAEA